MSPSTAVAAFLCRHHRRAALVSAVIEQNSRLVRSASCLAALLLLAAAAYARAQPHPTHPLAIVLFAAAPLFGLSGYLVGVVLAMAGNLLRAAADTAAPPSPFAPTQSTAVVLHRLSASRILVPEPPLRLPRPAVALSSNPQPAVIEASTPPASLAVHRPQLPAAPSPAAPQPLPILNPATRLFGLAMLVFLLQPLPQPDTGDRAS